MPCTYYRNQGARGVILKTSIDHLSRKLRLITPTGIHEFFESPIILVANTAWPALLNPVGLRQDTRH